jgi:hypothetical protein
MINRRSGGGLVKPWEVDEVPEDFVEAYESLNSAAIRQQARDANEKLFQDFRRQHNYRQY